MTWWPSTSRDKLYKRSGKLSKNEGLKDDFPWFEWLPSSSQYIGFLGRMRRITIMFTLRWKGVQCHVFGGIPLLHLNLSELFSGVTSRWDSPRVDDWFDQLAGQFSSRKKTVPHLLITPVIEALGNTQQRKNSTYLYTVWSSRVFKSRIPNCRRWCNVMSLFSMNFYCLNS